MKKILILITILSTALIIGFNVNNINAQTTVVVDIDTYLNGDLVISSQRTVNQGATLIYEVENFPNAIFMYWVVNDVFRDDLQQDIIITVNEDTILEIHFGNGTYYSGFDTGYYRGTETGKDLGLLQGFNNGRNAYGIYFNGVWRTAEWYGDYRYNAGLYENEAYQQGLKDAQKTALGSFDKWIVPAIIVVIILGGFVTIIQKRKDGDT